MKAKQGFVSNSSTSSFVLLTTSENHERALAASLPYVRAVMEVLFLRHGERVTFMGAQCVVLRFLSMEGMPILDGLEVKAKRAPSLWHDGDMDAHEALEAYKQEAAKGDCYACRIDEKSP